MASKSDPKCPDCGSPLAEEGRTCQRCLIQAAIDDQTTVSVEHPASGRKSGEQIGSYRLLDQIGEGGMGQVFMAEQKKPFRRRVALKIIKPGMDSKEVLCRFEAERQAVALMDHTNIARVYEAGTTGEGRPYFAMELVEGKPITQFCDERKLSLKDRLDLFRQVCQAVQHAHQKGIIHRDLKPSNILVTTNPEKGDRPVPKIIDFGVAKALGPGLTENTLYTMAGQIIGTPQYMSPEQAAVGTNDVDTRSDIYSLGVLLYELLTGTTPLEMAEMKKAGLDAILRSIREKESPKPSTKLHALESETQTTIAEARQVSPAKLSQRLRGDLDWVVMKALEKERSRRYDTANALAADITHFLKDEPVSASPPSAVYRFRKFARRNRGAVGSAVAVALILIASIGATWWQTLLARQEESRAETARLEAEKLIDFMAGDLKGNLETVGRLDLLERTVGAIDSYYENNTRGKAENRESIRLGTLRTRGEVFVALGQYEQAHQLYVELLNSLLPREDGSESDSYRSAIERARTLLKLGEVSKLQGNQEKEGEYLEEGLSLLDALEGEGASAREARLVRSEMVFLLYQYHIQRRISLPIEERGAATDRANEFRREAYEIFQSEAENSQLDPRAARSFAVCLCHWALWKHENDREEAEQYLHEADQLTTRLLSELPSDIRNQRLMGNVLSYRSSLLERWGRHQESLETADESCKALKKVYQLDPRNQAVAAEYREALDARAYVLKERGYRDRARQDYEAIAEVCKATLENVPAHHDWLSRLAGANYRIGDMEPEASLKLEFLQRAKEGFEKLVEERPSDYYAIEMIANVQYYMPNPYLKLGKVDEAIFHAEEAVQRFDDFYQGRAHRNRGWSRLTLTSAYLAQDRFGEAEKTLREAADVFRILRGSNFHYKAYADSRSALSRLPHLLENQNRHSEALPFYEELVPIQEAILKDSPADLERAANLAKTLGRYASCLDQCSKQEKSSELRVRLVDILSESSAAAETSAGENQLLGVITKKGIQNAALVLLPLVSMGDLTNGIPQKSFEQVCRQLEQCAAKLPEGDTGHPPALKQLRVKIERAENL